MKKNDCDALLMRMRQYIKILLLMKLSILLVLLTTLQVSASETKAQNLINLDFKDATLETIFRNIESQGTYTFVYKSENLPKNHRVTVFARNASLNSVMNKILQNTDLSYRQMEKNLVVIIGTAQVKMDPITGRVTDGKGNPLPLVTVTVKGTQRATTTDENGNYSIEANDGDVLVFSYVGYTTKEITISGQPVLNVNLLGQDATLDDIVIIGYQAVRRKDLTGAAAVVDTRTTERTVSRSLPEALQGLSSGITVRNGGAPGQGAVVNIRGLSTLYGDANPLYVIDGMLSDPNVTVNTNDIESIQILKDASAAAIYGSRSANGVIIITTKKGREGPMKVNGSARYSISRLPKMYEMMSGPEYVAMNKQAYQNAGYTLQPSVANYDGTDVNWADQLFRQGSLQDYNVSISGGGNSSKYFVSGSYLKDVGTLIDRKFDRAALRINTEAKRGRFTIGENVMISTTNGSSPFSGGFFGGNPFYDAFNMLPIIPVKDPSFVSDVNPGGWGVGSNNAKTYSRNQVAQAGITHGTYNYVKLIGNLFVDFKLANWLNYKFNTGLETSFDKSKSIRGKGIWYWNQIDEPTRITEGRSQFLSYLFEHTLNFNKKFNLHDINGVVGYTQQTIGRDGISAGRINLLLGADGYFETINSASGDYTASGSKWRNFINSYLGRLNYAYDDKYLATFTFRSDKDSRFSKKYRTGFFPSVALAWRLDRENFFNVGWIDDLKLRGSYGVLGAANLATYQYMGLINQSPRAIFGSGEQNENVGATQATLVDGNLKWEQKATTNLGIDASFVDRKLTMAFDVFRSVTKDVLLPLPLPHYLGNLGGTGGILTNIGSIENKGLELEFGFNPHRDPNAGFAWDVKGNVSFIRNKILELGNLGIDPLTGQPRNYIQSGNTRSQIGRAIGEYYLILTNGIFQNQDEINAHRAQAGIAKPGDIRYINLLDRGTNNDISAEDRAFAGTPWPVFTSGLLFNSYYKNFSLNIHLYGVYGNKLYNDMRRDFDGMGYSNYRKGIVPWTVQNPTDFPRLGVSYTNNVPTDPAVDQGILSNVRGETDRWLENGSYLRLRNIQLNYTLSPVVANRLRLSSLQVYVSGQNLLTLTKYSGMDPDVVGANANLEPGVDNGNWPSSRIVSVGLNLGL